MNCWNQTRYLADCLELWVFLFPGKQSMAIAQDARLPRYVPWNFQHPRDCKKRQTCQTCPSGWWFQTFGLFSISHMGYIYGYIILPHWLTYICFKMVIAPPASPTFSRVFSVKHPQQKSAMLSNCLARPGPTKSWTLWGVAKPWNVMCAFCWSSPSAGRVDRVDVRCGLLLLVFGDGLLFWNFVCWCCWNWTFTVTAT